MSAPCSPCRNWESRKAAVRFVSSTTVASGSDRQYDVRSIGMPAPSGVVADEVDRAPPVEVALRDPLGFGGLHVEATQLLDLRVVVPLVDHLHRGREAGLLGGRRQREVVHRLAPLLRGFKRPPRSL